MCIATAIDPRFRGLKTFSSEETLLVQNLVSQSALELSSNREVTPTGDSQRSKPCSSSNRSLEISTTSSETFSLEERVHNENEKYFRERYQLTEKLNHYSGGTATSNVFHTYQK